MESSDDSSKATNFIFRSRGNLGIAGGVSVMVILIIVIVLSKMNEIAHSRISLATKRRLKNVVLTAAKHLRQSEESKNKQISYYHALSADTTLKSAKLLAGGSSLSRITGYDIDSLETNIEKILHNGPGYKAEEQATVRTRNVTSLEDVKKKTARFYDGLNPK